MEQSFPLTKIGFQKLKAELDKMKKVDRVNIANEIAEARTHGDLAENSEYIAAREQQAHIEDRIMFLENVLAKANVIDVDELSSDYIMFGAKVKMVNEDTDQEVQYQIVSEFESDISQGLISHKSPIGSALIGKTVGESISFSAPNGEKYFEILEIRYN